MNPYTVYYFKDLSATELVEYAKGKASKLGDKTQINLTADSDTYTIFKLNNMLYIGKKIGSNLPKWYKEKGELTLGDKDGKPIYKIQNFKL